MHITRDQTYILSLLEKTKMLTTEHIHRLIRLVMPGKETRQIEAALRQLRYMGKVIIGNDETVSLPTLTPTERDDDLLDAFTIMLDILKEPPLMVTAGKPPYTLRFLTCSGEGVAAFTVICVPIGAERRTKLLLNHTDRDGETIVFRLYNSEQRQYINCVLPHYFAVPNGSGFRYYKGGDIED